MTPRNSLVNAAIQRGKECGISITLKEDFAYDRIEVLASCSSHVTKRSIDRLVITQGGHAALAQTIHGVIEELLLVQITPGAASAGSNRVKELERELENYKATVKLLAFQLEMSEHGGKGVLLKEDEVRRLALEQAAEHLMDHGVITTGNELVAVCEQIKKLKRSELRVELWV